MKDYDEATSFLGETGPYFLKLFLLLSWMNISNGFNTFYILFVGGTPQHHCLFPEANISEEWKKVIIPLEVVNGDEELSKCSRYRLDVVRNLSTQGFIPGRDVNLTDLQQEGCVDGWSYSRDIYHSTIVTEWDLVCDNGWKVPLTTSILYCGFLFGSLVSGALSDRFGRKTVIFLSTAVLYVLIFIQAFSPSWEVFCVLMFFIGSCIVALTLSNFVLATEVLSKPMRQVFTALGSFLHFCIGYMTVPGIAYGMREWRTLIFIFSTIMLVYLPFWWFIPESPRWLFCQGRVQEAETILRDIAKKNKVEAPHVIFEEKQLEVEPPPTKKNTLLDLLKTSNIRCITLMCLMLWISVSMGYFGLSLNSANLSGNPYLNCFLSAVCEVPGYIISTWLLKKSPRRPILLTSLAFGGGLLLLIQLIPESLQSLAIALEMVGKFCFTVSFCTLYMYTAELYPTVIRNAGIGLCSCFARLGSITAPYVIFLGTFSKYLPYIIIGSLTIGSSMVNIFLPETFNKDLPETIEQMQRARGFCWKRDGNTCDLEKKEGETPPFVRLD